MRPATIQALRRELSTLPDAPPVTVRRHALERVRAALGASFAALVPLYEGERGGLFMSRPITHGDDDLACAWSDMGGRGADELRLPWAPRHPSPDQVNRFRSLSELDIRDMLRRPVWARYYAPYEAIDQVRTLVYDGPVLLGWLGFVRRRGEPRFGVAETRGLQRLSQSFVTTLSTLASLERERLGEAGSHLVLDHRGRVQHAARDALALLAASDLREVLGDMVRRLEAGREVSPCVRAAGFEVRLARLDATPSVAWVATARPLAPVRRSPVAGLSARQREIAGYAAAGATVDEIAAALSISPNTIKHHLKRIYSALEVANRVELAEALRE